MPPRAQFVVHSDLRVTQQSITPRPRDQLPICLRTSSLHGAQVIRSENILQIKLYLLIHFSYTPKFQYDLDFSVHSYVTIPFHIFRKMLLERGGRRMMFREVKTV